MSKEIANPMEESSNKTEYMDIPLGIPPLTMSADKEVLDLKASIKQQIKISLMSVLAYIVNEL